MKDYTSVGKEILKVLNDHGYEAYFVGGFVRDFLLEIPSTDIDITTQATPEQVAALFPKTKNTGAKFGTVTVFQDHFAFEVTTFRTDGFYADNRHPQGVRYSETLEQDLIRRDFTINALAMDRNGKIIDLCQGIPDLRVKVIRAIGDPDRRFQEDALRILRAFRFVSKLNFSLEEKTFQSIAKNRNLLSRISNERIIQELKTILPNPYTNKAYEAMVSSGVADVFPDLSMGIGFLAKEPKTDLDSFQFFALCFYLSKHEIADFWRFSNKEKDIIQRLCDLLTVTETDSFNEYLVYAYGMDLCLKANQLIKAIRKNRDEETRIREIADSLPIHKTCDLVFKGQDILELGGIEDARIIGEIVGDLVLQVITHQLPNEYNALKNYALQRINSRNNEGNE